MDSKNMGKVVDLEASRKEMGLDSFRSSLLKHLSTKLSPELLAELTEILTKAYGMFERQRRPHLPVEFREGMSREEIVAVSKEIQEFFDEELKNSQAMLSEIYRLSALLFLERSGYSGHL